jgi:hypothetical protein
MGFLLSALCSGYSMEMDKAPLLAEATKTVFLQFKE